MVRQLSKKWQEHIGNYPIQAKDKFDNPIFRLCEELYGRGNCAADLGDDTRQKHAKFMNYVRLWTHAKHPKPVRCDELWAPLGLLYFGPKPDNTSYPTHGMVALLLYVEYSPMVCCFVCHP